jgi:CARDB
MNHNCSLPSTRCKWQVALTLGLMFASKRKQRAAGRTTKANKCLLCVFGAFLLLSSFAANVGANNAPTGKYVEAVVQIVFSDEHDSDHSLSLSDLKTSASEINNFFTGLSYGKLDFEIYFARVHLPKTYADYVTCASTCNLSTDATNAAVADNPLFLDGVNGISTLILTKYVTRDITGLQLVSWPGVQQQVASSALRETPKITVTPPTPSGVWWGGWAHEFGHQLEVFGNSNLGGPWVGHPAGYLSGYDLMDSCYPCDVSGFALLGAPFVEDTRTVFPGWLDADHVATVPIPTNGPVGQTFVLAPLSENISNPVIQTVKIPIDVKRYYMVNSRKRINDDAVEPRTPPGIFSEGVQIQYIDEDAEFPVKVCVPTPNPGCSNSAGNWPFLLWKDGDTFFDQAQQIKIAVVSAVTDGYEVNVTRDVPPTHPDLFITPWLTPPGDTYETVDIWVDSSCNGYEDQGGLLKYGRRADGTVVGNGDDPCVNHENRVYATIHNIGDAEAPTTTATFQVSSPLGVGVSGGWTPLGTVPVPSIPAGNSASVFVTWTPVPNLTPQQIQQAHFQFHTCIQVLVAPTAGEIITSNNNSQENINLFEAVAQGQPISGQYRMPAVSGTFAITNAFKDEDVRSYELRVSSQLPAGWTYTVNQGLMNVSVREGESLNIPVQIVPADSPVGQIYHLKVDAYTVRWLQNPESRHPSWYRAGGLDLNAHTVLPSQIYIRGARNPGDRLPVPTQVTGSLRPARQGAIVTIDYFDGANKVVSQRTTVGTNGSFSASLLLPFVPVGVRAIWQGDMLYSSAVATGSIITKRQRGR